VTLVRFGRWLDAELKKAGLYQSGLAAKLHVSEATVSGWMHGKSLPKAENARKLAGVLRLDVLAVYRAMDRIPPAEDFTPAEQAAMQEQEFVRRFGQLSDANAEQALTYLAFLLEQQRHQSRAAGDGVRAGGRSPKPAGVPAVAEDGPEYDDKQNA